MNLFLSCKHQSGLSYRAIARQMGITHAYAYRIIEHPGRCNNLKLVIAIGAVIGMPSARARMEWARLRIEHIVAKTKKKAGV